MKEKILKEIENLKQERSRVIKGKHASPIDMLKKLSPIEVKIERLEKELKKLD